MRGAAVVAIVLASELAGACDSSPSSPSPPPPSITPSPSRIATREAGAALVARFECTRCHDVPGIAPAHPDKHCVRCHQEIHANTFAAEREHLERWKQHITSLRWVPSLAAADRLQEAWVQAFLLAPHDVRPGLVAQMPRLALTADEAATLAAYLVDTRAAPPAIEVTAVEAATGEQLFRSLACARCHRFTGAAVDDPALHARGRDQVDRLAGAWELAPDLRVARARMTPAAMAAWIAHPRGAMPALGVSADGARALAAFIATTPLAEAAPRTVPLRLPVLSRAVTFDEVDRRVFKAVCWHCHAVPDFARGDGGPGNSGGFGFAPRGLDLASYEGIASGSLDEHGERRSVFAKLPDGTPRLVAHLVARHIEEAGGRVDGVRGMPLGLPPLSFEDIQLVESWIVQGRPRSR